MKIVDSLMIEMRKNSKLVVLDLLDKEEMKKEGLTKISVEWMVKILDLHDDTGFERLKRKWDISSVRNSLTRRLRRIGFEQHADKTWSISESDHQAW